MKIPRTRGGVTSGVMATGTRDAIATPPVSAWLTAMHRSVSQVANRHSIHTYFNVTPESPDSLFVLFFASTTEEAHFGDLIMQECATGLETVVASGITVEDAHRAACQQWMDGGKTIVYHDCRDGQWVVLAVDRSTLKTRILATDRQLGFGSAMGTQVPLYGCHWNPGDHRDLELVDLHTGAIRTVLKADEVAALHPEWVAKTLPENGQPLSIFFPVISPDGTRVFFKLARGSGGDNFRTSAASAREGKFVYDLTTGKPICFFPQWGHPSWHPDSRHILEKGNLLLDTKGGPTRTLVEIPTDHPSFGPDGSVFVSDGKASHADFAETGNRVVTVGSATSDEQARVDLFKSTVGARSWRKSHAHPVFSPDGQRIYYNVNAGPWTELHVAEVRLITEPIREIPVQFDVDVVVCGGGAAGMAAAVCASRMGLSVALLERSAIPGGMITHVTCWLNDFANKGGFPREFLAHLREQGIESKPYYNPWLVVPYFDALIADNKIRVVYLANAVAPIIHDGILGGVIVESKSGRTAVTAKIVIDATGDGDIAARAGAKFEQGRACDGQVQGISLSQMLMNYTGGKISHERMTQLIAEATAASGAPYWYPYDHWHPDTIVGTERTLLHTVPHATGYNPTDAVQLSDALTEMRRQASELFNLLKNHVSEFKDVEFGPLSAIPGVRESRRIVCDKRVTREDLQKGSRFEDGLFVVTQGIDIHRRDRYETAIQCETVKPYQIPYGALLPVGLENLLVVGRCIGGDHTALASYRVIANCMAMGEAAALAANYAIAENCSLRKIPVANLVADMASRGYE